MSTFEAESLNSSDQDQSEFNYEECFCSADEDHDPECPYAMKLEPLLKVITGTMRR